MMNVDLAVGALALGTLITGLVGLCAVLSAVVIQEIKVAKAGTLIVYFSIGLGGLTVVLDIFGRL